MKSLFLLIPILGIGAGAIKIGVPSIFVVVIAAVGIGSLAIAWDKRRTKRISPGRAGAIAYYMQVRKEIGIDPYTARELYLIKLAEDQAHNKNYREIAAAIGNTTYIDASGHRRDVSSNGYLA